MTGVLLVNMGGAASEREMKTFLARMFCDPCILPFGKIARKLLSFIISNTRYKKSWKKYERIGGTPILKATQKTVDLLQEKLGDGFLVKAAFSYSRPFINESLSAFIQKGISDIAVIPLYPQSSHSTTLSVERDINNFLAKNKTINISFIREFYKHPLFIEFWAEQISRHVEKQKYAKPYLLFSAHSIPEYMVANGDTYPEAIKESARLIAESLNMDFEHTYQSGMRRGKWTGPDTKERLGSLAKEGKDEIVIIPISFVNENLETLYDIDLEIIPYGQNEQGIKNISRVNIPEGDPLFIRLLEDLIKSNKTK